MNTDVSTQIDPFDGLKHLTNKLGSQEAAYVRYVVQGLNPSAAARAAGYTNPAKVVIQFAEDKQVQEAIAYGREIARQSALASGALEFTRDQATILYLEAHLLAATAAEKIKAVDSLVKLHGLAEPEKKEIRITSADQLKQLDSEELARLADSDILLDPNDYFSTEDE